MNESSQWNARLIHHQLPWFGGPNSPVEMGDPAQQPIGISLMQLTISTKRRMAQQAKDLLERVEREPARLFSRQDVVELISTIAFYQFTDLSRRYVERAHTGSGSE